MVIDHGYFGGRNHFIYLITWLSIATLFAVRTVGPAVLPMYCRATLRISNSLAR